MKNTIYPEIVNQMKKKNEKLGNLVKLLELKNISQVSRRLTGENEFTLGEAEILCKHYNIDFWELFRKEEK